MLHMNSILVSFTVMQFILSAVLLVFWFSRRDSNGLVEMALAAALGGFGSLIAGIGAGRSDFAFGFVGMTCVVFAALAATRSMARLQGRRPQYACEAIVAILGVGAVAYFALIKNSVPGILVSVSAVYILMSGLTARALLAEQDPALKRGCRILGVLFGLFTALHLVRFVVRPFIDGVPGPGGQILLLDILFAFVALAIVIGWSLGLLWTIYNSSEYHLRAAYEELERFSSAVAHDLKTPLNAVIGNIEAATSLAGNLSPEQQNRFLSAAHEAALRMNHFITDLLADARAAREPDQIHMVDPHRCFQTAHDNLRPMLDAVSATVSVEPLPPVAAAPIPLTRIFQNLLDNAIKYRCHDRALEIRVSAERADGAVAISIRDNGLGIARADHDRVFERFERAGKKNLVQGEGVGLSECRRISVKFGGKVMVDSSLGDGATFIIVLPAARGADAR